MAQTLAGRYALVIGSRYAVVVGSATCAGAIGAICAGDEPVGGSRRDVLHHLDRELQTRGTASTPGQATFRQEKPRETHVSLRSLVTATCR